MQVIHQLFDSLTRSFVSLPHLWNKFLLSVVSVALTFKIPIFWLHIRACCIILNSHVWTQKSDITRTRNQLFELLTCPFVCLSDLCHKFAIFIMCLSFRMFEHKNPISYEPPMNFLIYSRALVCASLVFETSFLFLSCLMHGFQNNVFSISYYRVVH